MSTLRIALPKGRMGEESVDFLYQRELTSLKALNDDRKLIIKDPEFDIEYLLIRSKDVGTYVETGAADIGIMGYDLLTEYQFDVLTPLSLPFGGCRMSVAYPAEAKDWHKRRNLKVATKYPNLASRYFFDKGHNIDIILLYGSIEIAPLTGLSDLIVDLVSTGQTLKANHLFEGEVILQSTARLIMNPSAYVFKRKQLNDIIKRLQ